MQLSHICFISFLLGEDVFEEDIADNAGTPARRRRPPVRIEDLFDQLSIESKMLIYHHYEWWEAVS